MTTEDPFVSLTSNLVLLGVGAGITGILVPYFTRRWQDRKAALKLKEELVKHIATSVTRILRATESAEHKLINISMKPSIEDQANQKEKQSVNNQSTTTETPKTEKQELLEGFRKSQIAWLDDCPGIGSTIHTYYHRSKIKDDWEDYYHLIQEFYKLTETDDKAKREPILENISEYAIKINPKEKKKIDQKTLADRSPKNKNYMKEWDKLYEIIYYLKHELMANIIETNMAGFSEGINWLQLKKKFKRGTKKSGTNQN